MRRYELTRQQMVTRPLERIFPFFEKPENLGLITPPSLGFKLLTQSPVEMRQGQTIDYNIRLIGISVHWRSVIPEYDPPHAFVDEQLIGPYSYWRHLHQFVQAGPYTLIMDRVTYSLPKRLPRLLETAVHELYVAPALHRIFDYRQRMFAEIFSSHIPYANGLAPDISVAEY